MKRVLLTAALSVALALVVQAQGYDYDDWRKFEFEDSFTADLSGVDVVDIEIVNGAIDISTWSGDSIDIKIEEKVRAEDEAEAADIAETVKLVGRTSGAKLIIELDYGGLDTDEVNRRYACTLKVKLPGRLALDLMTVNGHIEVADMQGRVEARSTNGHIELAGCKSDAFLSTTNGHIEAGTVAGELRAETTNGSIALEGAGGPVTGSTTNGGITVRLTGDVAGDVDLETTNGSITLEVGPGADMSVRASASHGRIYTDFEGGDFDGEFDRKRRRFEGTFGSGAHNVNLRTSNGIIRIKEK